MLSLIISPASNITHSVKDGMRQRAVSNNLVKDVNSKMQSVSSLCSTLKVAFVASFLSPFFKIF